MAKKDLRQALDAYEDENPALAFLTTPADLKAAKPSPDTKATDKRGKVKPVKKERYDRRVFLLMKPSVHDALTGRAKAQGMSINAYINSVIDDHLENGE